LAATTDLFERPQLGSRAVLVHFEFDDDTQVGLFEEFKELATSAGAVTVAVVSGHRRAPDAKHFIGRGKVEEIAGEVAGDRADLVIFDHRLSPAQERNLERALQCRVLDRIGLILDIFAQRASTFEGKLQVELAQLNHLSSRLVRGWTHLERQKGGIGLRGPGETQLETDRRLIGVRIKQISRRLEGVRRRRGISRKAREKRDVPVVSLVGYTNAGKSTLFNRLTGASVVAQNRLFATLDPTLRRIKSSSAPGLVLADTVGFIANLPHELVAAFRATLEETERATLLVHVIDASTPGRYERIQEVNGVLASIGTEELPQIEAFNKIDATDIEPHVERDSTGMVTRVWLSASTGAGVHLLNDAIEERLARARHRYSVTFPAAEGRFRARLYDQGAVIGESYNANGDVTVEVDAPAHAIEDALVFASAPNEVIVEDEGPIGRAALASEPNAESTNLETR
jgi:GTP-binding protein HflX